jgi:hypothetical protein
MLDVTNPQKLKDSLIQCNTPFPVYGIKQTPTPLDKEKQENYARYEKDNKERMRRVINSSRGPPRMTASRPNQNLNQPDMYRFLGKYGVNNTKTPITSTKLPSSPIKFQTSESRVNTSRQNSANKLQGHYTPNRHARTKDLTVAEGPQTSRSRGSKQNQRNILDSSIRAPKKTAPRLKRPYIEYPYRLPHGAHGSY